jgi:hypothetical protein
VLPKKIENWSLTSLQQRLVKTGGRLVKHVRYYWLMLAESHLTRGCSGLVDFRVREQLQSRPRRWKGRSRLAEICYGRLTLQPNRSKSANGLGVVRSGFRRLGNAMLSAHYEPLGLPPGST